MDACRLFPSSEGDNPMRKTSGGMIAVLAALVLGFAARATEPAPITATVEGMHCPGCAKKIAAQLNEVPGVASVKADVAASTMTVVPKAGQTPSPRALWKAVEKAGYKPVKLEGPGGTFTTRPTS
jgi:Cu+-exporting ATPase